MKKNPFEDLEMSGQIISVFNIVAKIVFVIQILGSIVGGVIMWVDLSALYGGLVLFGGVFIGLVDLLVIWLANIVFRCFYDAACATKELYEKSTSKESTKVFYIICNDKKHLFASDIVDDDIAFDEDKDNAMLFEIRQEAERVATDFELSKDDGWRIRQVKV